MGCRNLASILTGNPNLRILQIGYNNIENEGVTLLCEALLHPNCHLEKLGWVPLQWHGYSLVSGRRLGTGGLQEREK